MKGDPVAVFCNQLPGEILTINRRTLLTRTLQSYNRIFFAFKTRTRDHHYFILYLHTYLYNNINIPFFTLQYVIAFTKYNVLYLPKKRTREKYCDSVLFKLHKSQHLPWSIYFSCTECMYFINRNSPIMYGTMNFK